MRLIKILTISLFLSIFAIANDKEENRQILENLYEKVILKDINNTIRDIENLAISINKKNILKTKQLFTNLIKSWKAVETFYILGDLNEDFIDTVRLIDIFHNGNEDIKKQLELAIKSKDSIKIALFKNSTKSINALEYILFEKDIKNKRVNKIALTILNRISMYINDIKKEYITQEENFLKDFKKANAIIINAIIQSSYKLKEWRVGDVIGLTKKYLNNADNRRAEYYISKNSANAIESILITYKNVLDNKTYEDFGDYLLKLTDGKQIKELREALNKSLILVKKIKNDDFLNQKELYNLINKIHVILFVEMIEELSINAKILDADGD